MAAGAGVLGWPWWAALGLGPGRASHRLMAWGDFWCARSYAPSCFLFYLYDIINLKHYLLEVFNLNTSNFDLFVD